jgi:murein DD-endopeptidase MepM/ murein hydrolase activator NlpD
MWWALLLLMLGGKRSAGASGGRTLDSSSGVRSPGQSAQASDGVRIVTAPWLHPLPPLRVDGFTYLPTISDGYQAVATPGPSPPKHRKHLGSDIGYKRRSKFGEPKRWKPPRDASAGGLFFFPPGIVVRAAQGGRVWHVGSTAKGRSVTVISDAGHTKVWYQHLESVDVKKGDDIARGAPLGVQGFSPDGDAYRHLHVEVSRWNAARRAWDRVDPATVLRNAELQTPVTL